MKSPKSPAMDSKATAAAMKYHISELIDLQDLQELMESLHRATGINHALIDNDSQVLTAVGWQQVCTEFHRVNPHTRAKCLESDRYILDHLEDGPYVGYDCPNGLVDYATPLVIDGKHIANIFTGQVFHEEPDLAFFRRRAIELGFDEAAYLSAIRNVPIVPRERMPDIMAFLGGLAQTLGKQGLARLRQLETDAELRRLNESLTQRVQERTEEVTQKNVLLTKEIALQQEVTAALRQEKQFSDDLIGSLPGVFYVLDTEGRFMRWNQRLCDVTGYSDDEIRQRSALDFFDAKNGTLVRTKIREVFEGAEVELEAQLTTRSGSVPYYFNGRRTTIGKKTYLVGLGIDISGRVAAETQRRESDDKLRGLYELSPLGIALANMDGQFIEFNESFRRLCGYEAEELKRLDYWQLTPKKYEADEARQLDALRRTGRYGPYEKEYQRADGSLVPLRLNGMLITSSDGTPYIWSIVEDITIVKEHERELKHMAHYDLLTGIPNRALLADRLGQAIAQARRSGKMMAVCYLDLDGFKPINDRYGHNAGDRVLVEVARRLKGCLRGGDTVARIGGDEFVVLLLDLEGHQEREAVLNRIMAAVNQPLDVGGAAEGVSASLGVTLFPGDEADGDTLIRHADQAMYKAKQAGKNRYYVFDTEQDKHTRAHLEQISSIASALHEREFVLYYQPKVNMRTGEVFGAEALIRWQHTSLGLLTPDRFLPYVEDTDQITAIGDWVIAAALDQLIEWQELGLQLTVSVNIAAGHLLRDDFVPRLKQHFETHAGLAPNSLELEILETAAIEDIQHVAGVIGECQAMGVSFALDDFGTGYSSLSYLKLLPVETLKIDKSFILGMLENREDVAIVEGIIGLCSVFGRNAIAEGVETAEHGHKLLELGCELAQGYGVAHPMKAAELPAWVERWQPNAGWAPPRASPGRSQALTD